MVSLLFWNTQQNANEDAIGQLCAEYRIDLVLLAEADMPSVRLSRAINAVKRDRATYWELPRMQSRIRALTRYGRGVVRPAFDDGRVKVLDVRPPIGLPLLVVAVHLPSKLRTTPDDQKYRIRQLRADIEAAEARAGHKNSVVIGDFNVNPFEDALVSADGLHGVMDKDIAARRPRTVQGREWDYFYNPMWSRLGDESHGPPGTHWYSGSGIVNHFWNTYDQVLLRPGLLPHYRGERLIVPTRIGESDILSGRGGLGLSDHLPLIITLTTEETDDHG